MLAIASGPVNVEAEHMEKATRGHLSSEVCGLKTQTGHWEQHVDRVDLSGDESDGEGLKTKYSYMLFGHV